MTPRRELMTAPKDTTVDQAYELMRQNKKKLLPLVDKKYKLHALYIYSDVKRIHEGDQQIYNLDNNGHLRVGAAIGTGSAEIERALLLAERKVDVLVIDTAHGDSFKVLETLKHLKKELGDQVDIMAGNISEGASAKRLAEAGADGLRVGQGPGSICTTRIIAGIGCPQVSAIYNCAEAIRDYDLPICGDGGINNSGDITIALAAGADTVMLGRLLAGVDETPGDLITHQGSPYKIYRGMGSLGAMKKNPASRARYGEIGDKKDNLVPEGVEGAIPYKGGLSNVLHQYIEGLRRGMGYVGAADLTELKEKADFHRISGSGLQESHPHHIHITHDAPNYSVDK